MNKLQGLRLYSLIATHYIGLFLPLFLIGFTGPRPLLGVYFLVLTSLSLTNIYLNFNYENQKNGITPWVTSFFDSLYLIPWPLILTGELSYYAYFLALWSLRNFKRIRSLLEEFPTLPALVFRLTPLFLTAPFLVHFTACLWIALGSGSAGSEGEFFVVYVKAYYWAITTLTTVGYGDISAVTIPQMIFAGLVQVLGVGIFGYALSNVAGILARIDAARERHMDNLDKVETFMRIHRVPSSLKNEVRTYYQYLWQNKKGYHGEDLLEDLPRKMQSQLLLYVNKSIIEKVPFFRGASEDLLSAMMSRLESRVLLPGEVIFKIDDPGEEIYFIQAGDVEIKDQSQNPVATLSDGSFFGEMALISERPRSATAVAKNFCEVYTLSRKDFESLAQDYPSVRSHIEQIMSERQVDRDS